VYCTLLYSTLLVLYNTHCTIQHCVIHYCNMYIVLYSTVLNNVLYSKVLYITVLSTLCCTVLYILKSKFSFSVHYCTFDCFIVTSLRNVVL